MKKAIVFTLTPTDVPMSFECYRFPLDPISYAVWLYCRFPLSLRIVEEMLVTRGIEPAYETLRRWSTHFASDNRKADTIDGVDTRRQVAPE